MAGTLNTQYLQLDRLGYKWKGERYPRVTTIKSKKSTGNALVDWAARMVDEEVKRIVEAYRGKQMDERSTPNALRKCIGLLIGMMDLLRYENMPMWR